MSAEENVHANFVVPDAPSSSGSSHRQPLKTKKEKKPKNKVQNGSASNKKPSVFLPGKPLEDGEELVCDKSVYDVYQTMQTGAPCLSFDILRDELGDQRKNYPLTAYIVAGTQAEQKFDNNLLILKLMNMHRTKESLKREAKDADGMEDDDEESSDSSDDDDEDAELAAISIKQKACVNRIRATKIGAKTVVATWSECGKVFLWDISEPLKKLESETAKDEFNEKADGFQPAFSFSGHQSEGFGVDWSPKVAGNLLTGDCKGRIHLWKSVESSWSVDQRPFQAHEGSVEDIQWSPTEATVFASCSVDKTVRVWDIRAPPHKACMITVKEAHTSDVNVISWNRTDPFIVSGGDDGVLHVWDLRELQVPKPQPVATFKHHSKPVATVEWNPNDSSVFASAGEDDQVAFWDIAVEPDADMAEDGDEKMEEEVPPQLLFIHQGQKDIKELHWHPQIPGVVLSTALSGFNIFKPISV